LFVKKDDVFAAFLSDTQLTNTNLIIYTLKKLLTVSFNIYNENGDYPSYRFLVDKSCFTHPFLIYKLLKSSFKIFKKVKVLL
jgi:hypothetical protein